MAGFRIRFVDSGGNIRANFDSNDNSTTTSFEEAQQIQSGGILSNTTEEWNRHVDLIASLNTIYVYTDHKTMEDDEGNIVLVPGVKVGDGKAFLIDMPFIDAVMDAHINDMDIHVTPEQKRFWDNKNRGYVSISDPETLVLTVD